jgi:transmembrane sensor
MEPRELELLLDGYEKGTLTEAETERLEKWFLSLHVKHPISTAEPSKNELEDRLYNEFQQRLKASEGFKIKKLYTKISIAAAILIIASVSLVFYRYYSTNNLISPVLVQENKVPLQIGPGKNKAVLKLASGQTLVLGEERKGLISYQDSTALQNLSSTLTTPKGGQFHIVLADGTGVWLNASSSLTFPASFNNTDRRTVILKGEAYFEVAKNKTKPFFVNVVSGAEPGHSAQIEVLGTHFNINAYSDEADIKTTLVEGSVKLSSSAKSIFLKPGQQGTVSSNTAAITLKNIDPESAIAWKNGNFVFVKEDIHSVMRQIARWYDIEVIYKGDVDGMEFTGTISRYEKASEVLDMLAHTETIKFKFEGRRVTVMP